MIFIVNDNFRMVWLHKQHHRPQISPMESDWNESVVNLLGDLFSYGSPFIHDGEVYVDTTKSQLIEDGFVRSKNTLAFGNIKKTL